MHPPFKPVKNTRFILLWLILVFGLLALVERHWSVHPVLIWAVLLWMFFMLSGSFGPLVATTPPRTLPSRRSSPRRGRTE